MTAKRFKALSNKRGAWDIIDYDESAKINGFVIYNDLGNIDFSSAPQLVDLLNELNDECEFLKIDNEALEDGATKYAELYHKSLKENEQLKSDKEHLIGCLIRFFGYDDEDIDYNLNRESNREYGKQYYSMKEETKKELEK